MGNGVLTEEAEEDLANNNDPNNNAAEEFDAIRDSDFRPEFVPDSVSPNPAETDPDFEDDVDTIKKLLPDKSKEEIRNHLEAYLFHPKRLKVRKENLVIKFQASVVITFLVILAVNTK